MRGYNSNNPFGDSDSDNDMQNAVSQSQNRNNPFASQSRQSTNPFGSGYNRNKGSNPFDEDEPSHFPPPSPPKRRQPQSQLPNHSINNSKPPKANTVNRPKPKSSSPTPEMSNNSSHGGISRWFNRTGDSNTQESTGSSKEDMARAIASRLGDSPTTKSTPKKKTKTKKRTTPRRPKIHQWPYDNYHLEEQKYYAKMGDESLEDASNNDLKNLGGNNFFSKTSRTQAAPLKPSISHVYERPHELPSIKESVENLPLLEFERVANERAINIVSTFLFDSGLIDELLVNGGMTYKKPSLPTVSPQSDSSIVQNGNGNVGVEVGMNGFPVGENGGGGLKIEKEINRLRTTTQRQLSQINHRLNDGVASSGAEVQELVNAVVATKGDLGRLRELSTYTNHTERNDFILTNYPKLKSAMNARRNLFRCFRELEFFSQIPSTCDRLRDEMHSGEWTKDEWSTIRSVCMEHVDLQILLIEAESGMKAKLKNDDQSVNGFENSYDAVDRFLASHVKNVWSLGDEIRNRVLSGIGNAFEIALNNPAGMVALCEAVEVYERAEDQFKIENGGGSETLHFTNIRSDALLQLYQDFELRGVSVFRQIHMQAADSADEKDALKLQFSSILRGATELVAEIEMVKHQLGPCFPPHWAVEVLWSSCVSHVCSNQILQQIGGPEGNNLMDLSVTQLLDLVAWIEYFRIHIEESFPRIAEMKSSQKTYFDTRPELFAGNKKEVDMESATDSVAWANNMLWEVHRLAQEEFLMRTRVQTDELLGNVYAAEHEEHQQADGRLATSLCEDVFSLVGVQLRTIRDHLSPSSDALVLAVCVVFSHLQTKQIQSRDSFLNDLESCCASANDFSRMSEKCEDVMSDLLKQTELSESSQDTLQASASELIALYSSDAVFAAQKNHLYIFEPIQDQIAEQFFTQEWENNLTSNELAHMLVKTLEDFMQDLERFMDAFLVKKTVEALVTASVTFYVKCLLIRAENHNSQRDPAFGNVAKALDRFSGDVDVLRMYFESLVTRNPVLRRIIKREFEILTTIHEVMYIAADLHEGDASDFVLIVHKKIGDIEITKHLFGDLWHLTNPREERMIWDLIEKMEEKLTEIVPFRDNENDRNEVPGLKLYSMLKPLYDASKRKLPSKGMNWGINLA